MPNVTVNDQEHEYRMDGQIVPSVTQVLEDMGLYYNPYALDKHRNRGTAVHDVTYLIDGKQPWRGSTVDEIIENSLWDPSTTDPILVPYGRAWAQFLLDEQFHAEHAEEVVWSLRFRVCGRMDRHGLNGRRKVRQLVDIKSGMPGPSADLQMGLYDVCAEESKGIKTDERVVVWLKPDGTYHKPLMPRKNGLDKQLGLSAVTLWWWRKNNMLFA